MWSSGSHNIGRLTTLKERRVDQISEILRTDDCELVNQSSRRSLHKTHNSIRKKILELRLLPKHNGITLHQVVMSAFMDIIQRDRSWARCDNSEIRGRDEEVRQLTTTILNL